MPRAALLVTGVVLAAAACFEVPDYGSGDLVCDQGRCPPGYTCGADQRCRKASVIDAPLALDAPGRDGAIADARTVDGAPDAPPVFDARPCTQNDRRCTSGGVLEVCVSGVYVPAVPSCASDGLTCFDPAPSGGTDAYCGTCLKGAKRCESGNVQSCPATGLWAPDLTCGALGCVDLDGASGPSGYCRECDEGDGRCASAATLQVCAQGLWTGDVTCTATPGFTCFDPTPTGGGGDAYCGACVKNAMVCRGDNLDRCNSDGSGYVTIQMCSFGCNASSPSCCDMPTCQVGQICGQSAANACGRRVSCGPCSGSCCAGGELCCAAGRSCCDTVCCGSSQSCCEPGICSSGACP